MYINQEVFMKKIKLEKAIERSHAPYKVIKK